MCNCGCGSGSSCIIDLTSLGQVGDTGAQGGYGGYSSEWNFSTTTTSGTTAGLIRFNSATYASVTTMYINKTNADSTDLSNFLASFSNSTYFGKIRVFKKSDSSKFWEGAITAVSAGATEYTLTVTYTLANSTFATSDPVVVTFTPNGLGAKPIYFSVKDFITSATTGSWVTPVGATITIPAGMLAIDGDYTEVIVRGIIGATATPFIYNGVRGNLNGTAMGNPHATYTVIAGNECIHSSGSPLFGEFIIKFVIERYDSTTALVYVDSDLHFVETQTYTADNSGLAVSNFNTNSNTFEIEIYNGDGTSTVKLIDIKAIKYLQ